MHTMFDILNNIGIIYTQLDTKTGEEMEQVSWLALTLISITFGLILAATLTGGYGIFLF